MKNLFLFFLKYGSFFLFFFLQILCFYLIVNYNQRQESIFINSSNLVSGYVSQKSQQWTNFLNLDEENEGLRKENAKLLQSIINDKIKKSSTELDTIDKRYTLIASHICSKTLHLRNNFITLCKGSKDGIKSGMGVIGPEGIVGIVKEVSKNFAKVITVLHSQSRISVAIKNKEQHGYLVWDTSDPLFASVHALQKHTPLSQGDTIITSGYSTIFPKGINTGVVESYAPSQGGETYKARIRLFNNFGSLKEVYVINSMLKEEFDSLENGIDDGQ